MNHERFRQSPSGRLVKVGQTNTAYWAFVPNPLPPSFPIDYELAWQLSQADRALGELAGLGRAMPNPHLLISPFLRREAVLSSRIEGTQADVRDVYAYEAGQLVLPGLGPTAPESDVREVVNYVRTLEYGLKRIESLPVSLYLFRELHERLMERVRGERATPGQFRRSQNWIGPPGCTLSEATFVPPPVVHMQEALTALEEYFRAENQHPPLMRLGFIHYQFEAIHPFLDGNGRIGRLLISLLLVYWKLLPLPLLYLSVYFEKHRDTYYDLLYRVSEHGAWKEWIAFFLSGVAEQSRDAIVRLQSLQDLRETWRARVTEARSSSLPLLLIDRLFELPVLTIPDAQRLLGVTYPTAQRNVERLVNAGILEQIGESSYAKTFMARDIITIISAEEAS